MAARIPMLTGMGGEALKTARTAVRDMDGGFRPLTPLNAYGRPDRARRLLTGGYAAMQTEDTSVSTERDRKVQATPTEGATALTINISAHPVISGRQDSAIAWYSGGLIKSIFFSDDRGSVTVTLADGFTFPAGDTVFVYYQAES
jgi:hypothetical protein